MVAMTNWIALFRGINVGGNNMLPMKALRAELEDIGCTEVKTYIQSGNVVFQHAQKNARQMARSIGKAVFDRHGFEPKVFLLTAKELENVVRMNPFPDATEEPKTLHVFFLAEAPSSSADEAMAAIKSASESFSIVGNTFYLHAPEGVGRSKLAAKAERLLGVDATARNWRTVLKVLQLA